MKKLLAVSAAAASLVAGLPAYASAAPEPKVTVEAAPGGDAVPGQYIVTLKSPARTPRTLGTTLARYADGFAARLTPSQLTTLRRDPAVAAIEQDQIIKATTVQKKPTWGLDRIDETALPLSHTYSYKHTGAGVNAYVIDTGIDTSLAQFGGRADVAYDALGGNGKDQNGHGTHVAGIIGSRSYGVAKSVRLHSVRVLNSKGQGTLSQVIAGVNWVTKHHAGKAVANLSLGGGKSTAFNKAVTKLSRSGVFVTVATGNDGKDSCKTSPASAASVEAVGATSSKDVRPSFSNYGKCLDIYAPGVNVYSTLPGGTGFGTGTSMASPFVAGAAALYKSAYGDKSFGTIQKWLAKNATKGKVKKNKAHTHNYLLNKRSL